MSAYDRFQPPGPLDEFVPPCCDDCEEECTGDPECKKYQEWHKGQAEQEEIEEEEEESA
jgi:hypothetical protein